MSEKAIFHPISEINSKKKKKRVGLLIQMSLGPPSDYSLTFSLRS